MDVQELDSTVDHLEHRRRTLPEHAEIERLDSELRRLHDLIVGAATEESDLLRDLKKSEGDVEQVRQRSRRDQERLSSGAITSAKELESLQHEIASLERRQGDLEEIELEVMQRLEDTQRSLQQMRTEHTATAEGHSAAVARREQALVEIDAEVSAASAARTTTAAEVPPELLALYGKLRAGLDGVGAAPLRQRRCGGCRLELNASEIGRIRAAEPDEVLRCDECRRILIRTDESGL